MRYFVPKFSIATLTPQQTRLLNKIGGIPWGLPHQHWPICCGRPQKLIAQLRHEPPMLDLGSPEAVLHLFQCMECLGIGNKTGCTAFLLNHSDLFEGLSKIKDYDYKPELGAAERRSPHYWLGATR